MPSASGAAKPELDSMQFLKRVREKLAVLHLKDELLHRARERRLFRRREEAQRDFPDGRAGTEAGDPGRNRFRPRHRRAEDGCRRRQRAALARPGLSSSSPTTSACSTTSFRMSCMCWPTAASSRAADRTLALKLEEHGYAWVRDNVPWLEPADELGIAAQPA
jgi:hypothetical protein